MKIVLTILVALPVLLATVANALANSSDVYQIGPLSQREGPSQATIGASIQVSGTALGVPGGPSSPSPPPTHAAAASGSPPSHPAAVSGPPPIPVLPSNSPLFANPTPAGANSFWYAVGSLRCIYAPNGVAPCFHAGAPGTGGGPPTAPPNPATLAAQVARRLSLGPGRIEASPSRQVNGLTGAASWFWLSPSPATRSVSASLRGERVTVTAGARNVDWAFGDGSSVATGPGVPYRPGPAPPGAVRHVYQTRCLPGDVGHDPYVLSSCGADGYTVTATLSWGISFTATGPVTTSGNLPSQTTTTAWAYPVSEARGFLSAGDG
jgi:hypothetical protein